MSRILATGRALPPATIDAEGPRGLRTQRREWVAQRVGWALMLLGVVVGAASGAIDIVLRAAAIYVFMLIVLRVAGKRTFAQLTPFDLVLLLIISEVTQSALVPEERVTFPIVLLSITTLAGMDLAVGWATWRSPALDRLVEGGALVIVHNGKVHRARLAKEHVTVDEILSCARKVGVTRLDQIRYAILESDGDINVIPRQRARFVRRTQ